MKVGHFPVRDLMDENFDEDEPNCNFCMEANDEDEI